MFSYVDNVNDQNKIIRKKPNKKINFLINCLAIALLVTGGYGIKFLSDQQRDIKEAEEKRQELLLSAKKEADLLKQKKEEEKNKTNSYRDFEKLKKENNETIAWLYVPGTNIDLPIVKHKNNSYYLTHGYDKKYSSMGWAFADSKNTFPELSTNTIMYGHTYRKTTIFSNLKNVLESKWLNNKKKHIITLDTEKERLKFQVFSVYTKSETNDYLYINFSDNNSYQKYLNRELKRSIKDFDVDVDTSDKIITLSTCYNDAYHRLIVHGKLIGSE